MKSGTWYFYRLEDGAIVDAVYIGAEDGVVPPDGCAPVFCAFDPRGSFRFDVGLSRLVALRPAPPAEDAMRTWSWDEDSRRWIAVPTLAKLKLDAHAAIDQAAGQARMRYVTEVPGQQATYMRKLEQARAYASAGYTGAVPPYIQAEADATGDTPQGAADAILTTAALWDDVLSPGIEGARIGGKRAVTAASTAEAVQSAADAAIAALGAF
jgi:hypothetical protein